VFERVRRRRTARAAAPATCEHLAAAAGTEPPPARTEGCEECLAQGTTWVHLRICVSCGHVGCCDSSPWRHATGHFSAGEHPVMQSHEAGESWRWCYPDGRLG